MLKFYRVYDSPQNGRIINAYALWNYVKFNIRAQT